MAVLEFMFMTRENMICWRPPSWLHTQEGPDAGKRRGIMIIAAPACHSRCRVSPFYQKPEGFSGQFPVMKCWPGMQLVRQRAMGKDVAVPMKSKGRQRGLAGVGMRTLTPFSSTSDSQSWALSCLQW